MRDLLPEGTSVAVAARSAERQSAEERIEGILRLWDGESSSSLPCPKCLTGDVRSVGLGLDSEARSWIGEHCDRVIHSAAVLKLHTFASDGEPRIINVEGTRNILDLCEAAGIGELHYVSTAYVSGCRAGARRGAGIPE
jgi:thioester reductase-like protein